MACAIEAWEGTLNPGLDTDGKYLAFVKPGSRASGVRTSQRRLPLDSLRLLRANGRWQLRYGGVKCDVFFCHVRRATCRSGSPK